MEKITKEMLQGKRACEDQVVRFVKIFGDSAEITEANAAKALAAGLDISFLERFLTAPARAKYERVTAPAWAKYERVMAPAWAEYKRVMAPAWAEYERVTAPARAKYERVTAPAWAKYERVTAPARAKYERVEAQALVAALLAS